MISFVLQVGFEDEQGLSLDERDVTAGRLEDVMAAYRELSVGGIEYHTQDGEIEPPPDGLLPFKQVWADIETEEGWLLLNVVGCAGSDEPSSLSWEDVCEKLVRGTIAHCKSRA